MWFIKYNTLRIFLGKCHTTGPYGFEFIMRLVPDPNPVTFVPLVHEYFRLFNGSSLYNLSWWIIYKCFFTIKCKDHHLAINKPFRLRHYLLHYVEARLKTIMVLMLWSVRPRHPQASNYDLENIYSNWLTWSYIKSIWNYAKIVEILFAILCFR